MSKWSHIGGSWGGGWDTSQGSWWQSWPQDACGSSWSVSATDREGYDGVEAVKGEQSWLQDERRETIKGRQSWTQDEWWGSWSDVAATDRVNNKVAEAVKGWQSWPQDGWGSSWNRNVINAADEGNHGEDSDHVEVTRDQQAEQQQDEERLSTGRASDDECSKANHGEDVDDVEDGRHQKDDKGEEDHRQDDEGEEDHRQDGEGEEEEQQDEEWPAGELPLSQAELARRRMAERERLAMERRKAMEEESVQKDWYQKWLRRQERHPKQILIVDKLEGVPDIAAVASQINHGTNQQDTLAHQACLDIPRAAASAGEDDVTDYDRHQQEWYQKWLQRQALQPKTMIQIGMDAGGYAVEDLAGRWGGDGHGTSSCRDADSNAATGNSACSWSSNSWSGNSWSSWHEHKKLEDHLWYQKWLRRVQRTGRSA